MEKYKIYRKDNYIEIAPLSGNYIFTGHVKDVKVVREIQNRAKFRFYGISKWNPLTYLNLSQILDESGNQYSLTDWEDFYNQNTGNFNGGIVSLSVDSITDVANAINSTGNILSDAEFFNVSNVPVSSWNATTSFTSDAIEFTGSKSWAIQITNYSITPGAPTLSLQVSTDNSTWSEYKTQATSIDITDTANRVIFDDIMPFRYLRVVYVSGASTGSFSLKIMK